jgi:hypothetical protein
LHALAARQVQELRALLGYPEGERKFSARAASSVDEALLLTQV